MIVGLWQLKGHGASRETDGGIIQNPGYEVTNTDYEKEGIREVFMLETLLVIVISGLVGGTFTYLGLHFYGKYRGWQNRKNWRNAGKQWKYIVDYSTRAIVPETAEEERDRIEHARRFLDSRDLRTQSDEIDEGFVKTLKYLQDDTNPNRISSVSERQEHEDRMVEVEKNAEEFHKRQKARLA